MQPFCLERLFREQKTSEAADWAGGQWGERKGEGMTIAALAIHAFPVLFLPPFHEGEGVGWGVGAPKCQIYLSVANQRTVSYGKENVGLLDFSFQ